MYQVKMYVNGSTIIFSFVHYKYTQNIHLLLQILESSSLGHPIDECQLHT